MKLKELINYLKTAQEKLGAEAEVFIYNSYDDDNVEIKDIVMKAEQSLMDTHSTDMCGDPQLQICI